MAKTCPSCFKSGFKQNVKKYAWSCAKCGFWSNVWYRGMMIDAATAMRGYLDEVSDRDHR